MMQKGMDEIREIIGDESKYQAVAAVIERMEQQRKEANHQRQAEGIAAAKARGVKFGRPKMKFPKNFNSVYTKYQDREITATKAAELLDINRNSFRELIRRYEEQLQK